eukprot:328028-Prymnesium_polylepis.1
MGVACPATKSSHRSVTRHYAKGFIYLRLTRHLVDFFGCTPHGYDYDYDSTIPRQPCPRRRPHDHTGRVSVFGQR